MLLPLSCIFISSSSPSFHRIVRQLSVYEKGANLRQKVKSKFVPIHAKKTQRRSGVTAPLMRCVKNDTRGTIVAVFLVITMTIKRHQERRPLQTIYFVHNMSGRAASLYVGCLGHLITIRRLLFIKPNCPGSSQCSKRDSRFRNNSCFHSGKTGILYQ